MEITRFSLTTELQRPRPVRAGVPQCITTLFVKSAAAAAEPLAGVVVGCLFARALKHGSLHTNRRGPLWRQVLVCCHPKTASSMDRANPDASKSTNFNAQRHRQPWAVQAESPEQQHRRLARPLPESPAQPPLCPSCRTSPVEGHPSRKRCSVPLGGLCRSSTCGCAACRRAARHPICCALTISSRNRLSENLFDLHGTNHVLAVFNGDLAVDKQ